MNTRQSAEEHAFSSAAIVARSVRQWSISNNRLVPNGNLAMPVPPDAVIDA